MALLRILRDPDPTLRKISRPVDAITPRIRVLVEDMKDTLRKAEGVGLAAPQVGVLRRVVIVDMGKGKLQEFINPEIVYTEGKQEEVEGCLSCPGKGGSHLPLLRGRSFGHHLEGPSKCEDAARRSL